jgi:inner membrane protein involved in colicin E2 resistance
MTPPKHNGEEGRSVPREEGTTKVRFELWLVLSAMILLGILSFGYLNADQRETKEKQQEVIQRVVRLESNSQHIITQLDKIAVSLDKLENKLETHREKTEKVNK